MCSNTPLNIFIEKRKPRRSASDDDLAIVKAAARAWYQHTAGSKGKLLPEFAAIRRPQAPRPSKYKLEAKRVLEEPKKKSSLLDTYEIVSISKRLDEHITKSSISPLRETHCVEDILLRQESWSPNSAHSSSSNSSNSSMKKRLNMKLLKGFWGIHGIACGRREDVHIRALLGSRKDMFRW